MGDPGRAPEYWGTQPTTKSGPSLQDVRLDGKNAHEQDHTTAKPERLRDTPTVTAFQRGRHRQVLITGSVQAAATAARFPATGRVADLELWPLTQRELLGRTTSPPFATRLVQPDWAEALRPGSAPGEAPDAVDYIGLAYRGGFPDAALAPAGTDPEAWLDGYARRLTDRDLTSTGVSPDRGRFSRYLQAVAINSAGVVGQTALLRAADVSRETALRYDLILERLYLTSQVSPWWSNGLTRLTKVPKRYLTDTALIAAILRLDIRAVLRDGGIVGRMLDSFVAQQLRPELAAAVRGPRLYHLRDHGGRHEVDLVLEYPDGAVAGIEIKAAAAVAPSDARHLAWLRDQLGDRFIRGVVLHTGPATFPLGERLVAAPISTLWVE